ncbi:MAG: nitroreductase [Bacteroidales bacterium]|nr:MAG: nitroreductase [Bacteroidales bacterium]
MESFLELACRRFSCRKFKNQAISKELIEKVIEAARVAPSAVNNQPWIFIAITEEPLKKMIAATYSRNWIESAPVIIIACGDHNRSWRRSDGKDHCDIDIAIAIDHITLAATDNNLATCWVCKFDAMKCSLLLELPAHLTPIALIPLGFPDEPPKVDRHKDKRKPLNEILFWEGIKF